MQIGQIINTHGNRGELKVFPLTDHPERFNDLKHVYLLQDEEYRRYQVERVRSHRNMVILSLREITDMNEAEKLKGLYLQLPVEELKPLPPGHYYFYQIIGLRVYQGEECLGEVRDILKTGSNDVYVVTRPAGKEILVPALKDVVREINPGAGIMRVELPPGLMD